MRKELPNKVLVVDAKTYYSAPPPLEKDFNRVVRFSNSGVVLSIYEKINEKKYTIHSELFPTQSIFSTAHMQQKFVELLEDLYSKDPSDIRDPLIKAISELQSYYISMESAV